MTTFVINIKYSIKKKSNNILKKKSTTKYLDLNSQ